jgi:sensor domain CHASE-containing protein
MKNFIAKTNPSDNLLLAILATVVLFVVIVVAVILYSRFQYDLEKSRIKSEIQKIENAH